LPAASVHASGLAGRYAAALFALADDRDALDAVALDLHGLSDMIDESADLERLIRSPVLSRDEQGRAIAALAERAGFGPLTRQFLGVLAHKRRLFALPDMVKAYDAMLAEHKGEVGAEVISAVPLSATQLESVRRHLTAAVGQAVKLSTAVDPDLLGGLVVRLGSRMIDASIRTKLHQLELALKGVA
jgi:F-type H+-transporting ATPase subunit delta